MVGYGLGTVNANIINASGTFKKLLTRTQVANSTITAISVANPTVVTTSAAHGLTSGDIVTISGSNSTPSINGSQVVTVVSTTTFTVPVNVTVSGNAGTVVHTHLAFNSTVITSTYDRYLFLFKNLDNTAIMSFLVSTDGGATYDTGVSYSYAIRTIDSSGTNTLTAATATAALLAGSGTKDWGEVLFVQNSGTVHTTFQSNFTAISGTDVINYAGVSTNISITAVINSVAFTGLNIAVGEITLYGFGQ